MTSSCTPPLPALLQQQIELRYERFAAFAREALLSDVARVHVFLERLGRGEPLEDVLLVFRVVSGRRADRFETLLDPALLRHVRHVHVFDADAAAVGVLQELQNVGKLRLALPHERAGAEDRAHVGVAEPVVRRVELRDIRLFLAPQRIDVRLPRAERAVSGDQLEDAELFLGELRPARFHVRRRPPVFPEIDEALAHFLVRDVGRSGIEPLQLVEIAAPARLDRLRVVEIGLVERFDERRVRSEEIGVAEELFHHGLGAPVRSEE